MADDNRIEVTFKVPDVKSGIPHDKLRFLHAVPRAGEGVHFDDDGTFAVAAVSHLLTAAGHKVEVTLRRTN